MKRIIPILLLEHDHLIKTTCFKRPNYIGDPLNAIKIFNEKEVDELFIIDRQAGKKGINFSLLKQMADQSFMPLGYAGGIKTIQDIDTIFRIGFEKIGLRTANKKNFTLLQQASKKYGAQSIVGILDVKKNMFGKKQTLLRKESPEHHAKQLEENGAGEVLLQSVNNDGIMQGYDVELIEKVSSHIHIPLIALGGAGKQEDFKEAFTAGASAVAAGSFFVYYGPHKAVLINYRK